MKNIVFTYEGFPQTNIGDYIQSIAARQFYAPEDIIYFHRDELSNYNGPQAKVIMNGWFTHRPENWPPSDSINPLFVATHFNSSAYETLLGEESIQYLKGFSPIGCRDTDTMNQLSKKGIKAYFSSCLTTTLSYSYPQFCGKREGIYIVDPVHYVPEESRRLLRFSFLKTYLLHKSSIDKLVKSLRGNNPYEQSYKKNKIHTLAKMTRAYILLKKLLTKEEMNQVTVLTQYHENNEIPTNEARFRRAEELLNKYLTAKLVITSRIHCALPCTGIGTPVVFYKIWMIR